MNYLITTNNVNSFKKIFDRHVILNHQSYVHMIRLPQLTPANSIQYNKVNIHGEKFISKLYFFYKKIHYFYSDAGTHSKCRIFTVLNSTF